MSEPQPQFILCPYCGRTQPAENQRCVDCHGLFDPLSRKATQIALGPWTIRDKANPFRPGCSYEVLRKQVLAGKITPTTVIRGPTTHQLWSIARNVPGVAHLLGACHNCGASAQPESKSCPQCQQAFEAVPARDQLGLLYATAQQAEMARRELDREIVIAQQRNGSPEGTTGPPGADLLSEILGSGASAVAAGPPPLGGTQKAGAGLVAAGAGSPPVPAPPQAAPPPQPPAGAVQRGEALDFGPTQGAGSAEPDTSPDAQAPAGRIGWLAWSLIGLNVIVLILAILLFILLRGSS